MHRGIPRGGLGRFGRPSIGGRTNGVGGVRSAMLVVCLAWATLPGCAGRSGPPAERDLAAGGLAVAADSVGRPGGGALFGLWSQRAGRCLLAAPAVTDSVLVTVSTDGRVQAWRAADGRRLWGRRFKFPIDAAPAIARGHEEDLVIVAPRGKGTGLTALGLSNGKTRWQIRLPRPVVRIEASDTLIWVQDQGGTIELRSPRDGRVRWSRSIGGWDSPPFLRVGARLVAAARQDSVTALDATSGAPVWRTTSAGRGSVPPVLCGDRIVLTEESGETRWLRDEDGELLGRSRRAAPQVAPGVALGDRLVTVSAGGIVECSGIGESAGDWRQDLECAVAAPPVLLGERLCVATVRGALRALDPTSGRPQGVSQSRAGFRLAPIVRGARVILADDRGYLHVYRY